MRALLQRVAWAKVEVGGERVGETGPGLLVLLGVTHGDGPDEVAFLARKVSKLRVFNDAEGKMNRSVVDVGGGALVVSQFTLYADARRGNRPSYGDAAAPEQAETLYESFIERLKASGLPVASGRFGADMKVNLLNDGPVTILLDTVQQ